jgi:hypothetical protein
MNQGLADAAAYAGAALLTTIDADVFAAQSTFRHPGAAGFWYIKFRRTPGPTVCLRVS